MVYVEAAARMIIEVAEDDEIIVEKSTVPCRTAEHIRKILLLLASQTPILTSCPTPNSWLRALPSMTFSSQTES